MSARPDTPICPKCGAALPSINGLCATCLARSALDRGTGWLAETVTAFTRQETLPDIAGWRIIGTLGAGGMGRVYHGESTVDGTHAAIKVLDQRWTEDPAMVARFEREARALRQLDHPNIVRLIESTETDEGRLCIATELVQGCDLGRLLRAEKLAPQRAMEIFSKVCAAVEHAHEHGLVHRDIKPSNILVGRDGEVKLADFGLAREAGDAVADASVIGGLTATTDQFGTAYYLAPERMQGNTTSGAQSDVFSLGVLLYHLLTGQMPVGKYSSVSQLTGLPRELDAIISKALEADPAMRTASVAELHQRATKLWRDHSAGTLRRQKLRRIAAVVAGLALLVIVAIGSAWIERERLKPRPVNFADPASATKQHPWENSLGMKFVPVPGTKVLFSIYELRRRDAEPFIAATSQGLDLPWLDDDTAHRLQAIQRSFANSKAEDGEWVGAVFHDPGWPVTPDHPVTFVSALDAFRACQWLTWKERTEGRLKPHQRYRLPTTAEWLAACGGENAAVLPGNVAGPEAREGAWPEAWPTTTQRDPFPRTAPVGSFPAEMHGLFDISGNATEWVSDDPDLLSSTVDEARKKVSLRGPAFTDGAPEHLSFAYQRPVLPRKRIANVGVRVVLELGKPE